MFDLVEGLTIDYNNLGCIKIRVSRANKEERSKNVLNENLTHAAN